MITPKFGGLRTILWRSKPLNRRQYDHNTFAVDRAMQLAGAGAFLVGAILSLHYYAIGICFIAGAAAFYVGMKLKAA